MGSAGTMVSGEYGDQIGLRTGFNLKFEYLNVGPS